MTFSNGLTQMLNIEHPILLADGFGFRRQTDAARLRFLRPRFFKQSLSALGHVWTAPWQELSDVAQHWSGAVMCPACLCGGLGRWP
jgi:hypothetical protein